MKSNRIIRKHLRVLCLKKQSNLMFEVVGHVGFTCRQTGSDTK